MTVYVKDASKSVLSGLGKMKAAMIADYADFMVPDTDTKKKMERSRTPTLLSFSLLTLAQGGAWVGG